MTPAPRAVIAAALEEWWITTDPVEPFVPATVAADVELHLISSGYRITQDDRTTMPTPRTEPTCDASTIASTGSVTGPRVFGPCTLRQDHDGPVHKDATGTTWARTKEWCPSRASIAVNALIVVACLTATVVSVIVGHWWWTAAGGIASAALTHALVDEIAERRHYRRGRRT
ncbi:hypothetical protein AB0E00_36765 [Streptomyces sp. NPDC048110]|uniref:hypothetical protein n=1 Tax=Streptomyces sp. NPDC048110 TaxID=3155483 RepID=UPI0033FD2F86